MWRPQTEDPHSWSTLSHEWPLPELWWPSLKLKFLNSKCTATCKMTFCWSEAVKQWLSSGHLCTKLSPANLQGRLESTTYRQTLIALQLFVGSGVRPTIAANFWTKAVTQVLLAIILPEQKKTAFGYLDITWSMIMITVYRWKLPTSTSWLAGPLQNKWTARSSGEWLDQ